MNAIPPRESACPAETRNNNNSMGVVDAVVDGESGAAPSPPASAPSRHHSAVIHNNPRSEEENVVVGAILPQLPMVLPSEGGAGEEQPMQNRRPQMALHEGSWRGGERGGRGVSSSSSSGSATIVPNTNILDARFYQRGTRGCPSGYGRDSSARFQPQPPKSVTRRLFNQMQQQQQSSGGGGETQQPTSSSATATPEATGISNREVYFLIPY